ncbi:kinase-like protein [Aspergillus sclerotioniger CBS 115572]|uniref:non-specific serine/threonine protein kinase n=1 Tax=Aspergillus sclerotioniger CBS 115572 TaxID=1450535 RepID=A0A317UTT8_9EURO|nr:kinase-like protein [Aspergillus sclerotioniger CBS 115572]PWY64779.1 kinase-like protein [Aspergillus sclerotioniger CBS 115572]
MSTPRLPRYSPSQSLIPFRYITSSTYDPSAFEYELIEDVERLERYRPGGYHPVCVGDVLHNRYRVIHKLGHGAFSTIWLSRDEQRAAYVAIKVSAADSSAHEGEILRSITDNCPTTAQGRSMIPVVLNQFEIQGPNGHHRCYVTAPAQSSVSAAMFCRRFQIETARVLAAQLVLAVSCLHFQGVVHGDIHLGNVLLRLSSSLDELSVEQFYEKFGKPYTEPVIRLDNQPLPPGVPSHGTSPVWLGKRANEIPPEEAYLPLSDFGESFSPSNPQHQRLGEDCHTPLPVAPPEAYFEPTKPLSFSTDIWTLACAMWSIFGLRSLFDATLATLDYMDSQQINLLGPLPRAWWVSWEARHEYFEESGEPKKGRFVYPSLEQSFEKYVQASRRRDKMCCFSDEEKRAILDMLRPMLVFKPEERATVQDVLRSDWMVHWGLPAIEKSCPQIMRHV